MAYLFETQACNRCGGSGKYSYNTIDGDRCYGCAGAGVTLTKRGKAAAHFLAESQHKPLSEIKPGMFLWDDTYGYKPKWLPILSVSRDNGCYCEVGGVRHYYTHIETKRGQLGVLADSKVRVIADEAERQALVAAALAYQATLTKTGKPMKRLAA